MKKNKINLVWLHSHFLYWMGGTKFIYQVITELKKGRKIASITVLVEKSSPFVTQKYEELNIDLQEIGVLSSNSFFYWLFLPVFLFLDFIKLTAVLRDKNLTKDDTVIVTSMFPMNVLAGFLGFRHVQNCYEPFAFFYDRQFIAQFSSLKKLFLNITALLYAPLDKWATAKSDALLTLNSTTQQLIKNIYGRGSIKTQAGVNSKLFKPYVSDKIRKKYKGEKIVIHSTDYSPVKGTDKVISAFAVVSKSVPQSRLLITTTIDEPAKRKKYELLTKELGIADKADFLGFVSIELLPQYYTLASVMVQGAFSEKSGTTSMSLPVKEAMCCGTPAIRPNVGGDDVVDGQSGFLVDPRNTELLAAKMTLLLQNDVLSEKMGKRARNDIAEKYTWENTARVFLENLQ